MAHDIVQSIVVHFMAHALDHVLRGCDDVLIKIVGSFTLEDLLAHSWVKDEILSRALLQSRDVLDAESVGVEPR